MGNKESAHPAQATYSTRQSANPFDNLHPRPSEQSLPPSGDTTVENRDENFNETKDTVSPGQSRSLQLSRDVGDRKLALKRTYQEQEATEEREDATVSQSCTSQRLIPPISAMTPVTLPTHHAPVPSGVTPSVSSGVTYTPYANPYPSPMAIPPFGNYIPVGTQLARYPPVESYSAMLANMGTQFQLAQEQSHQSYIPSGYITLAGPHVSVPPVLIPAALHDRDRGIPVVAKTSSHVTLAGQQPPLAVALPSHHQPSYRTHELLHNKVEHSRPSVGSRFPGSHNVYHDTHTVKVGGTYIPAVPNSTETGMPRRNVDITRASGHRDLSQQQIPSLDAVLGKTTYTQHASGPGGIRIELPPPTIGIHIGARPPNLVHHSIANVPPLISKSNVYMEVGESSKVVPSSLSAPMTCIGETFASSITTPYLHKSSSRNSFPRGNMENPISISQIGPFMETQGGHHSYTSKPREEHIDTYIDRSNNSQGLKSWPANSPGITFHEAFQVKDEHVAASQRQHKHLQEQARVRQSASPTDKQKVQSSRPILTAQAPPPMANVPSYFTSGSIIQLANGHLRRVEELHTDDFISSAKLTDGLKIDSSTVSRIEEDSERNVANISFLVGEHNAQVTVEARLDHPFFVYGQGWSSVSPDLSQKCYALNCHSLAVGDVCVSLTVVEKMASPDTRMPSTSIDMAVVKSEQSINNSPERKRQRFHETRTTHFDVSVDDERSTDNVATKTSSAIKSLSLDQQTVTFAHEKTYSEGIFTDQNRNVISEHMPSVGTMVPTPKEASRERWNQPPKRRWSDPIKCSQAGPSHTTEALPNPPHPSSLAKLPEEK